MTLDADCSSPVTGLMQAYVELVVFAPSPRLGEAFQRQQKRVRSICAGSGAVVTALRIKRPLTADRRVTAPGRKAPADSTLGPRCPRTGGHRPRADTHCAAPCGSSAMETGHRGRKGYRDGNNAHDFVVWPRSLAPVSRPEVLLPGLRFLFGVWLVNAVVGAMIPMQLLPGLPPRAPGAVCDRLAALSLVHHKSQRAGVMAPDRP